MKYVFSSRDALRGFLKRQSLFIFLDYDGTLTPIVKTPERAVLAERTKKILRALAALKNVRVAVISGRMLGDLKKRVGLHGITYVGNHGLEGGGGGVNFKKRSAERYKKTLRRICSQLEVDVGYISGVIIEDKGLTLSVHYRLVRNTDLKYFHSALRNVITPYRQQKTVVVRGGKKVYEVRPAFCWDKGMAVLWLLSRYRKGMGCQDSSVLYIGDDTTDEDAFLALKTKGLTVFVGKPGKSFARYFVRNTQEVIRLLRMIIEKRKAYG